MLMSNIYAEVGEWNESKKIRRKMKDCNISKEVGGSWIEVDGMINVRVHSWVWLLMLNVFQIYFTC